MHKNEPNASSWNTTIRSLLEKAAYALDDEHTVLEISARTQLSQEEVSNVLMGTREATVEGLYRIASLLNVPPADLINPSNTVIQCYSIDGGRPRTLSLTYEDSALISHLAGLPILYADRLDGSYALLAKEATVIFLNKVEQPIVNSLYLCEKGNARYVRRCVFIDVTKGQAVLSDDAPPTASVSKVFFGKLAQVGSDVEMILGRVVYSINSH